jgi:hypothetical protein
MMVKTIKTIIIIGFFWLPAFLALGDMGNCVRYKALIFLNDETEVTGWFQSESFDMVLDKDNGAAVLKYLKEYQRELSIYKRIQTINFPKLPNTRNFGFKLSAAAIQDTQKFPISDILGLRILEIHPCEYFEKWPETQSKADRFYNRYHHWIINGLTQDEIDRLQTKPIHLMYIRCPFDEYDGVHVLSYNPSLSKEEVRRLSLGVWTGKQPGNQEEVKKEQEHYERVKNQLRQKNITVIHLRQYI